MEDYNLANGFLTSWDDQSGYNHYYILDSYFYDEKEPGVHLGVSQTYESKSNLKTGDSILSVNGEKIRERKHLWDILDKTIAGEEYTFTLLRNGKQMTVKEKFMSNPDGFELFRPCLKTPRRWMGVYMVQSLDSEWRHTMKLRDQGKFEHSSLCSILEVYPGSPADKAGLRPNDLIVDYGMDDDNGEIMPYDVIKCLYKTKPGESMELTIVRNLNSIIKIKINPEETRYEGYF
jgi:C-terminal processing protease CtpA/Prc